MSSESVPGPDSRIRLVLWRHGQTPWNVQGRFQGQTDIQLDEVGVEQAERAARLLAALRPDVIISSDLSRAMATAAPLSRLTGQERRILELIGHGLTNRQIGERLGLAEKTVKNYVSVLFAKLGMERRTQAAAYAARVLPRG